MAHMTDKKINLINPLVSNVDLFTHATALLARYGASGILVDELHTLIETAHLLRSEKNAQRLLRALQRASQP